MIGHAPFQPGTAFRNGKKNTAVHDLSFQKSVLFIKIIKAAAGGRNVLMYKKCQISGSVNIAEHSCG